jgi:hypothetical protein
VRTAFERNLNNLKFPKASRMQAGSKAKKEFACEKKVEKNAKKWNW